MRSKRDDLKNLTSSIIKFMLFSLRAKALTKKYMYMYTSPQKVQNISFHVPIFKILRHMNILNTWASSPKKGLYGTILTINSESLFEGILIAF